MTEKNNTTKCALCEDTNASLTFHHLVPRKMHKKTLINKLFNELDLHTYGIMVCAPCHKMIHKKITHHDLATKYNTLQKLKHHFELSKFIRFKQKSHKNKRVK